MSSAIGERSVQAVLLDIEGTTTPADFVYKILFPFARARVKDFLARRYVSADVQADIAGLLAEHVSDGEKGLDPPRIETSPNDAQLRSLTAYVEWLIDRDRKSTPLKSLQGKIWEEGYQKGELRGEVFSDVPPAMERWRKQGKAIGIFSSGSVLAQKLLFAHTTAGDLTKLIDHYFDTTTGPKTEPNSYRRIAEAFGRPSRQVLFISDVTPELDGARQAGMDTALCVRAENCPPPGHHSHPVIYSFAEVLP